MKFKYIMLFIFCAGIFSGCAVHKSIVNRDESKCQDYVRKHPELENTLKTAIIERRVVVGMSKEQLKIIHGKPCSIRTTVPIGYEIWFYNCTYKDKYGTPHKSFYFPIDGDEIIFLSRDEYKSEFKKKRRMKYVIEHPNLTKNIKKAILAGKLLIGMTGNDVVAIYGDTGNINRSVGTWGVHEQWIYGNVYIYFKKGKVTSWQD